MVHISTEITYALQVRSSGYYLDGRDTKYTNPLATGTSDPQSYGSVLHWKFELLSNGYYALKCLGNNWYLDGRDSKHKNPLMTNTSNPLSYGSSLHWEIKDNGSNGYIKYVSLKCIRNNFYVDGRDSKHNDILMADRSCNGDPYLTWRLIPLNCTLFADIYDFDFGNMDDVHQYLDNQKEATVIDTKTVVATEPGLTVKSTFSEEVSNSFSYGFSQSVGGGCGASITCGVPTIAETTLYVNFTCEFSSNQTVTETQTQSITEEYWFTPEDIGTYEVGMIVYTSPDVALPFNAKVKFTAIDDNNGGKQCSGNEILSIMDYYGNETEITSINDTNVMATVSGVMTGGWYVDSLIWNDKVSDASKSYMKKISNEKIKKFKSIVGKKSHLLSKM